MAVTKKESGLEFFNKEYNEYKIDYRENSVTLSYDFVIDTGTAKIIIKIGQKRWKGFDNISIVDYLKSKKQQFDKALLDNQDAILSMK